MSDHPMSPAESEPPERWLPAHDGWASLYEVSSLGRVCSLDRITPKGRRLRGRMLNPFLNVNGYLTVDLVLNGVHERWPVHQLVARVFIDGTVQDQAADKVRDRSAPRGEKQWSHKLTWEIAAAIRRLYAGGERQADLAERYGVAQSAISGIVRGRTWRPYEGVEAAEPWRGHMTEETVRALHARHAAGEAVRALAAEAGINPATLYKRFRRITA